MGFSKRAESWMRALSQAEAERDSLREELMTVERRVGDLLMARLRAEGRAKRYEDALRPFADVADPDPAMDDIIADGLITYGDLRRAHEALEGAPNDGARAEPETA